METQEKTLSETLGFEPTTSQRLFWQAAVRQAKEWKLTPTLDKPCYDFGYFGGFKGIVGDVVQVFLTPEGEYSAELRTVCMNCGDGHKVADITELLTLKK